jgi:GntR family transcriptional repressor for pyruvate dehydrogenase complex
MRDALQRMNASLDDDAVTFSQADIDFHLAVLLAVGNYFIPALLAPVDAGLREIRTRTSQNREMNERAIAMHTRIYEAIRAGSARKAASSMALHLEETRAYIAGSLRT